MLEPWSGSLLLSHYYHIVTILSTVVYQEGPILGLVGSWLHGAVHIEHSPRAKIVSPQETAIERPQVSVDATFHKSCTYSEPRRSTHRRLHPMKFRGDFGFGEPNRLLQASVLAKFGPRRLNSDNESLSNIVFGVPAYYEVRKCFL